MTRKLIIDGNAVYEIDEDCMLKNRVDDARRKEQKNKSDGCKYGQKRDTGGTAGYGRLS